MKNSRENKKREYWRRLFAVSVIAMALSIGRLEARAEADGTSFDNAIAVEWGKEYTGTYQEQYDGDGTEVFYKFSIKASGVVSYSGMDKKQYGEIALYDDTKSKLERFKNPTEEVTYDWYLNAGDYYIGFSDGHSYDTYPHKYLFSLSYSETKETIPESQKSNNNTIKKASGISLGKTYIGQLGYGDAYDYYKYELEQSGCATININVNCKRLLYILYDENGNEIDRIDKEYQGGSGIEDISADLTKGTYYFALSANTFYGSDDRYYGTYTIKTSFASAEESFEETGADNAVKTANAVELEKEYKGQIALNDTDDYYKVISTDDGTLSVTGSSDSLDYVDISFYTASGNKLVSKKFEANEAGINNFTLENECSAGTYYVLFSKSYQSTGNYAFSVKLTPKETKVAGIKLNKDKLELTVKKTETLTAAVTPENAANKTLTWSSDNTSVATVNAGGTVTAVKAGTATITAAAADGSKIAASCTVTVKSPKGWLEDGGKMYWYEQGIRQGTYDDPKGVIGDGTVRGREICDPKILDAKGNGTWFWLDAVYGGAKACSKEVWMPYIYQDEKNWDDDLIDAVSQESGDMAEQVKKAIQAAKNGVTDSAVIGKWVRYDAEGKMIKGWYTVKGDDEKIYPGQAGNTYYYDFQTGLMAKGTVMIDGQTYTFDEVTGVLVN